MSVKIEDAKIEVDIVRLDSDIVDEHLRSSTAVLHDILCDRAIVDNGHACDKCGKIYKTASTLRSHCSLKHPEDEIEAHCTSCDKTYSSILSLRKHMNYMHLYKQRCTACYRTFASADLLITHGKLCSKAVTPCTVCGKVFDSDLALRNHIKYKHSECESHRCDLCRRSYTTSRKLANHVGTVHPPGGTTCVCCDKNFNSLTALQSHLLHKHSQVGAKCEKCHKVFAKNAFLRKHFDKHHL